MADEDGANKPVCVEEYRGGPFVTRFAGLYWESSIMSTIFFN